MSYEKSDQILVLPQDWYVKKEQAREFALDPFGLQQLGSVYLLVVGVYQIFSQVCCEVTIAFSTHLPENGIALAQECSSLWTANLVAFLVLVSVTNIEKQEHNIIPNTHASYTQL